MAIRRWLGTVPAVKQVSTITIGGTVSIGNTCKATIGFAEITVTATAATTANVAGLLFDAMRLSTFGEFLEFDYSINGSVITCTAKTAGVPITLSTTPSGSMTAVVATPTAATGPNFVDVAANWSGSTLPTTSDTIVIESGPSLLYGLTTITAVMAKVTIEREFEGTIGLPEISAGGYVEYRTQHWPINTSALEVGHGNGRGSSRIKINLGTQSTAVVVYATGSKIGEEYPLQLIGGTSATANIIGGSVAFAARSTDTAGYTSITTGAGSEILCGTGCTHTTLDLTGDAIIQNTCTTLTCSGGTTELYAAATTLNIDGGTVEYHASTTLPAVNLGPGTLDCADIRTRTITTLNLRRNARFFDPSKTVTIGTLTLQSDAVSIQTTGIA